ncbi:OLC1v1007068C1 [Oldenlandia corymbosa var. corymbosa]|uniref:RING-type E3 ubiquitin transferase n=1 Tax=Oldenlandia corymbosa var. corymbosa TaxID=529605 RepID=A0AAV1DIR9_OLDCO|nr:OLC1v1007068C1 [Oldenlandia corymbosa var. corymbosa]
MERLHLQEHIYYYIHESQNQESAASSGNQPPLQPVSSSNGFPILAIAVLGIMAATFLLVSYYIFVTKCCFSWQQLDPLRRFSFRRTRPADQDFLMAYSPNLAQRRGLDEVLIREIPTFKYQRIEGDENSSHFECVVCLAEFQDQDMLRLLPKCSHAFHLDCIDLWLQSNTSCPLCRTNISGRTRVPVDMLTAPNSSPQDPQLAFMRGGLMGSDEDFVVIDLTTEQERTRAILQRQQERIDSSRQLAQSRRYQSSRKFDLKFSKGKPRKSHHASIMGDECINVGAKDDQFSIKPIRRSFSMDSAADRHVYLSVQEILKQQKNLSPEVKNSEECNSSRSQRSIFSFGYGKGSKRAVLPIDQL